MRKSIKRSALVAALCLATLSTGCYGPFNLTKKFHHWTGTVDGPWGNEAVFFFTSPVYLVTTFCDAIIFNSIEFWGGTNPISASVVTEKGEMDQVAAVVGLPYTMSTIQATGLVR